jgi:cell division protein FtsZ
MSYAAFGAKIKVIGVGGGGGNAVNTMIKSGLDGVEFIVANTDSQALQASVAHHKIQLGKELTKGLGAGADPDIGRDAALEDRHELQELLSDADMVFITAGMGGGTGTGAAAVVAQIAREMGALTVAVVTKPFTFEGKRRRKNADMGIARLREAVDTLITIPNQRLLQIATPDLSMLDAFKLADNVLVNAVRGISDIINTPGLINVDFADVKTVMSSMGHALMGIGYGVGPDRALSAAKQAISSPLLEDIDIEGATGILINITAGTNVSILEVNNACMVIQEAAHEDANIIFGAVIDESLGEEIRITVIATGFPVDESLYAEEGSALSLTGHRPQGPGAIGFSSPQRQNPAVLAAHVARPFNTQRPITSTYQAPQQRTYVPAVQSHQQPLSTHQTPQSNTNVKSPSTVSQSQITPISHVENSIAESKSSADVIINEHHQIDAQESQPSMSQDLAGMPVFSIEAERSIADMVFREQVSSGNEPPQLESAPKNERVGAESNPNQMGVDVTDRWAFDEDLSNPFEASLTFEIDRKIDEALALASRLTPQGALSSPSRALDEADDLDLPAFLRHGASELPK